MGQKLLAVVERVMRESQGIPHFNLARLNLKVGKPITRDALRIPDDPAVVARAEQAATEILREEGALRLGRKP